MWSCGGRVTPWSRSPSRVMTSRHGSRSCHSRETRRRPRCPCRCPGRRRRRRREEYQGGRWWCGCRCSGSESGWSDCVRTRHIDSGRYLCRRTICWTTCRGGVVWGWGWWGRGVGGGRDTERRRGKDLVGRTKMSGNPSKVGVGADRRGKSLICVCV